jgi:hypothetical protein
MSISFSSGLVEKQEEVNIRMTLDPAAYARHAQAVGVLVPNFKEQMLKDDELKVAYDFTIEYFGNVVRKLEAVEKICSDPDVVVAASCPELEQGRLLVYEALKRLEAIIKSMKGR